MKNKLQIEHDLLLQQHARVYEEFRVTSRLLQRAIAFIERQSGATYDGNMEFTRQNGTRFWITTHGKVYDYIPPMRIPFKTD